MDGFDLSSYMALFRGVGLADFRSRTRIEMTGEDRAGFLHNLCTNDIRKLAPGNGCEAFLTNVQGKTLSHVCVFCFEEFLLLETVSGQASFLLAHLDKYHIRERVEVIDRSDNWDALMVAGADAESWLSSMMPSPLSSPPLSCAKTTLAGQPGMCARFDLVGPNGLLVVYERDEEPSLKDRLVEEGAVPCPAASVEAARIEAGWPLFGVDITDQNLPQEVARDERAISFVKGCYLGQETVARIDALGHVNKKLAGVRFDTQQIPQAGTPLLAADEAEVGSVTSAAWSPRLDAPLALAYVRRGNGNPGTRLSSPGGPAEVVKLPV